MFYVVWRAGNSRVREGVKGFGNLGGSAGGGSGPKSPSSGVDFYSSFHRSESHKMQAVFFFVYGRQKGGSSSQEFLAETVETRHENLVDVLDNSARYSTMSKGKNMSNVLAYGVIFSTLKHTDPRTVRGRPYLKVSGRAF